MADSSDDSSDSEVEEYWDTDDDTIHQVIHSYSVLKTILLFIEFWTLFYNISAAAMNHLFQFLYI